MVLFNSIVQIITNLSKVGFFSTKINNNKQNHKIERGVDKTRNDGKIKNLSITEKSKKSAKFKMSSLDFTKYYYFRIDFFIFQAKKTFIYL